MTNKRGQDLSIGTLILIVLGIIVLVLLILGFSMGWSNLWEKINIFGGSSSVGDIATACQLALTSQDKYTLCEKTWKVKIDKEEKVLYCSHSLVKSSLEPFSCTTPQIQNQFTSACEKSKWTVADTCDSANTATIDGLTYTGKVCCKT